jgi:hypothetical protein
MYHTGTSMLPSACYLFGALLPRGSVYPGFVIIIAIGLRKPYAKLE